jgi:hypothetical protein
MLQHLLLWSCLNRGRRFCSLTSLKPISPKPTSLNSPGAETQRPPSTALVALLIAAFAVLAAFYGICIATAVSPFNAGAWVVGEEVAQRGWLAYLISALVHLTAAVGLWQQWKWSRWLAVLLLAVGLLPTVPGISAAVADLRIAGIVLWGTLIVLRTAALYVLMSPE